MFLNTARAENVVVYLKNGDKITGLVVSEYTNRLVLSNSWASDLSVPLKEIQRREITGAVVTVTNIPVPTNFLARLRSNMRSTNAVPPPLFKHWKGQAEVGLDLSYSTVDQRMYHGSFNLSYELPYRSNPKLFFRNTTDFLAEYGRTDGAKSADQIGGSDKTSFDLNRRWYVYNLAGVGYDRVREIALQAEAGPGMGYRLLTASNVTMNLEAGMNYQIQNRTDGSRLRDVFYRLAEDVNWKMTPRASFTEKVEFFPRVNFEEYRVRLETTFSYNLWRYLYLNTTLRDAYDTEPASGATANELMAHSALAVKF